MNFLVAIPAVLVTLLYCESCLHSGQPLLKFLLSIGIRGHRLSHQKESVIQSILLLVLPEILNLRFRILPPHQRLDASQQPAALLVLRRILYPATELLNQTMGSIHLLAKAELLVGPDIGL